MKSIIFRKSHRFVDLIYDKSNSNNNDNSDDDDDNNNNNNGTHVP